MEEIAPGLWHWRAMRESIGSEVSSYYLAAERVVIDPMIPSEGLGWFDEHGRPEHLLLTNRHHGRDAWRLREAFGCTVHCIRNGLHELEGRGPVEPFEFGGELPGGVVAYEVDAICPDECALHVPAHRSLAVADGVVRWPAEGPLRFVPDELMDEPERTKSGLRDAYRRLLDLDSIGCCSPTAIRSHTGRRTRCTRSFRPLETSTPCAAHGTSVRIQGGSNGPTSTLRERLHPFAARRARLTRPRRADCDSSRP